MSLDINVYTKDLTDDLIPKIVKRLNEFDMKVEIHPDFSFYDHNGFLPFKFIFKNTKFENLKNKELISGFEMYIDDFDLYKEINQLSPKLTLFEKIISRKNKQMYFANPEIDKKLQKCNKVINFVWHSQDSFEMRFASLTSAIISELTNGICLYPAENVWYENNNLSYNSFLEINNFEDKLDENNIKFHLFESW